MDRSAETVIDWLIDWYGHGQRYYRTLIGSRMCSVQWRHARWPSGTFQGQTRRRYVSSCERLSPCEIICLWQWPPTQQWSSMSPMCMFPREKLTSAREILALVEVCVFWVFSSSIWHNKHESANITVIVRTMSVCLSVPDVTNAKKLTLYSQEAKL